VARGQAAWIRSARADVALALAWVPFAVCVEALRDNSDQLATFLGVVALVSFVHQPLTLPLVYGDRAQFAARRRLFTLAPFVLVGAIAVGWMISLTLVAVVGGLWNMEHTLMQRYVFVRIYGRKTGEDDGRVERLLLLSWLVVTLLSVAADPRTPNRVHALPLGEVNQEALDVLASLRPYASALLAVAVVVAAVLTVRWVRVERARGRSGTANRSKQFYVASTAAMFAWAVLVDPVAGLAGYAGAHAVEYFFIVDHRLAADRSRATRRRFFAIYLSVFAALLIALRRSDADTAYTATVLFLGGLHFLYDGFIWKRRPVAATAQPILANASA